MIFDYKALLQLDDDTYTAWTPTLEEYEDAALLTAGNLNPNLDKSPGNKLLERYCKETVFIWFYGDGLSASLADYHKGKRAEYEEAFRYGGGSL